MTVHDRSNGHNGRRPVDLTAVTARFVAEPLHKHVRLTPVDGANSDQHDTSLDRDVRRASWMRQGFYVVVLLVALAGQVTGAVEALHIPFLAAIPAVAALELGGVVVLANADVRRRLGERAVASRLLSVAIAAWAVAFNWLAHDNHLLGGFFAGMSALGYAVWLMHTENKRRDRLRARGDLPPTTPAYELWGHWLRHPLLTLRARSLAKEQPRLGLYGSLGAARDERTQQRRHRAIGRVLREEIRRSADPAASAIALEVYDLDQVGARLAASADYDGLTALVHARVHPRALTAGPSDLREHAPDARTIDARTDAPAGALTDAVTHALADAPTCAPTDAPAAHVLPHDGATVDAWLDAFTNAPADAVLGEKTDALRAHQQTHLAADTGARVVALSDAPDARTRARTPRDRNGGDVDAAKVRKLAQHAARNGGTCSVRTAQRLLNSGAEVAKRHLRAAGLLNDENPS